MDNEFNPALSICEAIRDSCDRYHPVFVIEITREGRSMTGELALKL
jgi:hypothetical protein